MSEFELSTLAMLAILLVGLAVYSYWQIARVGRRQRAQQAAYDDESAQYEPPLVAPIDPIDDLGFSAETEPTTVVSAVPAQTIEPVPQRAPDGYAAVAYVPVTVKRAPMNAAPVMSAAAGGGDALSNVHYHLSDESVAEPMSMERAESVHEELVHEESSSEALSSDEYLPHAVSTEHPNSSEPEVVFHSESAEVMPPLNPMMPPADLFGVANVAVEPTAHSAVSLESEPLMTAPVSVPVPVEVAEPSAYYEPQDAREQASLVVFDPLIRFSTWVQTTHPAPIHALDGVIDLVVPQPKHAQDIEKALYDLRLDTDLPLRLNGRRAGAMDAVVNWQPLEASVLYSGLRLTLQLANRDEYAQPHLIQDWFVLAQRLAKRLAAQIQAMPDPAALGSYAMYLQDLSKRLSAPLMVQLHKKQGLWPAYEVHQQMTQWGLTLGDNGQYAARADDGRVLYQVGNDINNPRAQDFYRDQLPTMHVHTLSFCLDLSRVPSAYQPMMRMCHDLQQLAQALDAQWLNGQGAPMMPEALFAHADVHVPAYLTQLEQMGVPAGSQTMRRLLSVRA